MVHLEHAQHLGRIRIAVRERVEPRAEHEIAADAARDRLVQEVLGNPAARRNERAQVPRRHTARASRVGTDRRCPPVADDLERDRIVEDPGLVVHLVRRAAQRDAKRGDTGAVAFHQPPSKATRMPAAGLPCSTRWARMPKARAGSMSRAGSSPIITQRSTGTPMSRAAARKISGWGFGKPQSPGANTPAK